MRVLFIVQGEGRGHLTQALTTEALLRSAGHEVAEVLVGKSNARELPEFFTRAIKAPVRLFDSPNFLPAPANKRFSLPRSVAYNVLRVPSFAHSVWMLHKRISAGDIDLVVNFYELARPCRRPASATSTYSSTATSSCPAPGAQAWPCCASSRG